MNVVIYIEVPSPKQLLLLYHDLAFDLIHLFILIRLAVSLVDNFLLSF